MRIVKEEEVRQGRRLFGHFCTLDDGRVIYLARRQHRHIFRSGRQTISGAMTEGEAAWGMDERTLFSLRARGIEVVGVRVTDTGDLYLARLKDFFDTAKARLHDSTSTGGQRQRHLGLQHFVFKRGRVELDVA